jgi:hypothetical protein
LRKATHEQSIEAGRSLKRIGDNVVGTLGEDSGTKTAVELWQRAVPIHFDITDGRGG